MVLRLVDKGWSKLIVFGFFGTDIPDVDVWWEFPFEDYFYSFFL